MNKNKILKYGEIIKLKIIKLSRENPVEFIEMFLGVKLTEEQKDIIENEFNKEEFKKYDGILDEISEKVLKAVNIINS